MMAKKHSKTDGFTLVELLIVIVVIAILATISVIAYNGVISNAHASAAKSNLTQTYTELGTYAVTNGGFPATLGAGNIKMDDGTVYNYIVNSDASGYCLTVNNGGSQFYLTNTNNVPRAGNCPLIVSTLAGSTSGSADGQGTSAQFNEPTGIILAPDGSLYVADYSNNEIRKISTTGYVSTYAGSTTGGYADGKGTAATFDRPGGLAMDAAGNIYVADQYYSLIRKIDTSGNVTTLAGYGYGYVNANGLNARFADPWDVAVDASGNVYVADTYNNVIRKITPSADVTTLAGTTTAGYVDGSAASAQFNYPAGIAVAPDGTIYVADQDNNRIRKISTSGVVSTFAGSGSKSTVDGVGTSASFASPHSISIDAAGNMYVGDEYSHKVRKIAPDGTVATLAGTTEGYQDGLSTVAQFDHPLGVVAAPSGVIYVVERANNRVRVIQYQ